MGYVPESAAATGRVVVPVSSTQKIASGRYFVLFNEPALAEYTGGIANIPAPNRNASRGGRLDARGPASVNYVSYLRNLQESRVQQIGQALGRNIETTFRYQHALNGVVFAMSPAEADAVARMPNVSLVSPDELVSVDTDRGPAFIGATGVWDGSATGLPGTKGEGIVFGDIDSGINFLSPSFAATGGDGYAHTNPVTGGAFLGTCATGGVDAGNCNAKLIGAYDFIYTIACPGGTCPTDIIDEASATDSNGHGTHTAGTAAGNATTATYHGATRPISGVAPHANIVAYDVCYTDNTDPANPNRGLCAGSASAQAVEQSISDGYVDVLNYSISGGTSPWTDGVSIAFRNAVNAGIFVSASAGNSGPTASTVAHLEPWVSTTAASTHDRLYADADVDVTGPAGFPGTLVDIPAVIHGADGPGLTTPRSGALRKSTNINACTASGGFAGGPFPAGFIAYAERGTCNFSEKINNAAAAGAAGVIIANNTGAAPIVMSVPGTTIPSVMISQAAGTALSAWITSNPTTATASFQPAAVPTFSLVASYGDIMASFSSRGPNTSNTLKPDITAPGVAILAPYMGAATSFEFLQGTSMSSPHNAGAAILMKALRPTWTPPEIKSAMMLTSKSTGITKENATTPSDPFDRGAGRLNMLRAATSPIVLNETTANFAAATAATSNTLNTASYQNGACGGTCTFTRTFKSVSATSQDYTAAIVSGAGGITGTVTPSAFTLAPGAEQVVTVTLDVTGQTIGTYRFSELQITNTSAGILSFASTGGSLAIPDNLYRGGFGGATMACQDVTVALPPGASVSAITVGLNATHTWVGDVVGKLRSPSGAILGLFSRPGAAETADDGGAGNTPFGNSANFVTTHPITFVDTATASGENIGAPPMTSAQNVCQQDNVCSFSPAPGSIAQPPANLAALNTGSLDGTWTLCLGDRASGDTGTLNSWTLNLAAGGGGSGLTFPIAVRPSVPLTPAEINVTPASITRTLAPGATSTDTFAIQNTGQSALNWTITETAPNVLLSLNEISPSKIEPTITPRPDVLRSRGQAVTTRRYFESRFTDAAQGGLVQLQLDDGTNEDSIGLTNGGQFIYFNRFTPTPDSYPFQLTDVQVFFDAATGVDVGETFDIFIFSDADGDPANGATLQGQQTGVAVTATGSFQTYTLTTPVSLAGPGGDVLVAIVPRTAGINAGEFPAAIDQTASQTRSWVGAYGGNVPTPPTLPAPSLYGTVDSFGLAGNWLVRATGVAALGACGTPENATWLTVTPTSGTTAGGGSSTVTVTINTTGLAPGAYSATVCVSSNDADEANTPVTVDLTVSNPVDPVFADGFETP